MASSSRKVLQEPMLEEYGWVVADVREGSGTKAFKYPYGICRFRHAVNGHISGETAKPSHTALAMRHHHTTVVVRAPGFPVMVRTAIMNPDNEEMEGTIGPEDGDDEHG